MPEAVEVLGNFFWTEDDMGVIMNDINNGADPEAAAQEWFDNNQDKVAEWTDGFFLSIPIFIVKNRFFQIIPNK